MKTKILFKIFSNQKEKNKNKYTALKFKKLIFFGKINEKIEFFNKNIKKNLVF